MIVLPHYDPEDSNCYSWCKYDILSDNGSKEACNKLKCRCGARNCWWCTKPVENGYEHFGEQKCPLYICKGMILPRLAQIDS